MGHRVTYVRRKRSAECFNGEKFERAIYYDECECTEEDWECDLGHSRLDDGPCEPDEDTEISYEPP